MSPFTGKPQRSVTVSEIKTQLNHHFSSIYRRFASYRDTNLWNICMEVIDDSELLSAVIFCNDVLEIPPAKVFIELSEKGYISSPVTPLTDTDKCFIGSFWGFVFNEVLAYTNQKQVRTGHIIIKNAAYFYDNIDIIKVVKEVY